MGVGKLYGRVSGLKRWVGLKVACVNFLVNREEGKKKMKFPLSSPPSLQPRKEVPETRGREKKEGKRKVKKMETRRGREKKTQPTRSVRKKKRATKYFSLSHENTPAHHTPASSLLIIYHYPTNAAEVLTRHSNLCPSIRAEIKCSPMRHNRATILPQRTSEASMMCGECWSGSV